MLSSSLVALLGCWTIVLGISAGIISGVIVGIFILWLGLDLLYQRRRALRAARSKP